MINVTKPFLPPIEEYNEIVKSIWDRNWLTNNGPVLNELELKLKQYLDIPHLLFVGNGTIALQIAIKALNLQGEIITTPFSYVATTSSIVWENCQPVFVDIEKSSLNINADLIEEKITKKTTAILATHVYGNPCEVEKIRAIADKHNLKVIYDAAHCFGTKYKGRSIFEYGDISTASFHATKLFHTIEGGAVTTPKPELLKKMAHLRNFGHDGPAQFSGVGVNGKNSEFHAAMGVVNIKYVDKILEHRKESYLWYLKKLENLKVSFIEINENAEFNYSYFPIIFPNEEQLLKSIKELQQQYVFPRRYFYPTLNKLPYVKGEKCAIAEKVSTRVLCLPLYYGITKESISMIARILLRVQNS